MKAEMRNKTKNPKEFPFIEITLTTFSDNENGEISSSATGNVKIDGEDDPPMDIFAEYYTAFKSDYVRNLLLLSLGQFLLWLAFDTLSSLQSAINAGENMGQVSLAVVYGISAISSFFLPKLIIRKLGCRKTLVCATIGFCPYILANFHTLWSTLISSALLCGLASGIISPARSVLINRMSRKYAVLQRYSVEATNAWFFSAYIVFKQNTEIWGSLLSYYVLRVHELYASATTTFQPEFCGAEFCGEGFGAALDPHFPPEDSRFILVAIFSALSLISAFFLAFFLMPLDESETNERFEDVPVTSELLAASRHFPNVDQVLLFPLSLYTGLVDGFYNMDYKRAYVACGWGFPHIAAVSVCYGVVSALMASASGPCVQILGRAILFIMAALAHLGMFLALLFWKPGPEHTGGYFLVAGAFGIGNGIWMSQLVALYGVLFKENEEAGFSCFYFLNSLGFLLAYSYSNYLCTTIKIFIPAVFLLVGLFCYLAVEIKIVKKMLIVYNNKR